jgi:hypothetical protein
MMQPQLRQSHLFNNYELSTNLCGMTKFLSIADTLKSECKARFTTKEDNGETFDWSFVYKGHGLKLHYNIYNGVSICNSSYKDNNAVKELALMLEKKLY